MSTANPLHLYKNANLNGEDIQFDILLNDGLLIQTFNNAPVNNIALPPAPELLVIYGDPIADCFIQLDGDLVIPAQGVYKQGLHYIPSGCMKILDGNGAIKFGIMRAKSQNGTIIIECAHSYKDARKQQQHSRG